MKTSKCGCADYCTQHDSHPTAALPSLLFNTQASSLYNSAPIFFLREPLRPRPCPAPSPAAPTLTCDPSCGPRVGRGTPATGATRWGLILGSLCRSQSGSGKGRGVTLTWECGAPCRAHDWRLPTSKQGLGTKLRHNIFLSWHFKELQI